MTRATRKHPDEIVIGLVSISDRASTGVYEDKGIPALTGWLEKALSSPWQTVTRLVADDAPTISATLVELVDHVGCDLVLTTGGTGPLPAATSHPRQRLQWRRRKCPASASRCGRSA